MQQADLRPAIMRLEVGEHSADGTVLMCELATQPRSFRPAELLATFDPRLTELGVRRIEQWIIDDGDRRPPVPVPSESPPEPLLQAG